MGKFGEFWGSKVENWRFKIFWGKFRCWGIELGIFWAIWGKIKYWGRKPENSWGKLDVGVAKLGRHGEFVR